MVHLSRRSRYLPRAVAYDGGPTPEQRCRKITPEQMIYPAISAGVQGYEPVALMLRKDVPWFDERFRGPDGGRVAQAADSARHLSFAVHRSGFAVRVPSAVPEQAVSAAEAIYDQA